MAGVNRIGALPLKQYSVGWIQVFWVGSEFQLDPKSIGIQ